MEEKNVEFTLRDLLDIILPKLWLICIVAIIFGAASYFYNKFYVKDTYSSTIEFYLYTDVDDTKINSDAKTIVAVYSKAYKSDVFINNLKKNLAKEYPAYANISDGSLKSMISIVQDGTISVFDIVVTSGDPELSKAVAQCVLALSYAKDSNEKLLINDLVPHSAQLQLYNSPKTPTAPNSRNTTRNTAIAVMAGAILTTAAVVAISLLDATVRDKRKLVIGLNVPVLGVVPKYEAVSKKEGENNE